MNESTKLIWSLEYTIPDKLVAPLHKSYVAMRAARNNRGDNTYHCKICDKLYKAHQLYKGHCNRCNERMENTRRYFEDGIVYEKKKKSKCAHCGRNKILNTQCSYCGSV